MPTTFVSRTVIAQPSEAVNSSGVLRDIVGAAEIELIGVLPVAVRPRDTAAHRLNKPVSSGPIVIQPALAIERIIGVCKYN
ncbi:hypothetical protein PBS_19860 [Paraburkholderia sp. 2C]